MKRWLVLIAILGGDAAASPCEYPAPPPVPPPPVASPPCHRAPAPAARAIDAVVVKGFEPLQDGGTAKIEHGCDGLGARIRELVVETGSGHGGTLSMWRARRLADGRYEVRGITLRGDTIVSRAPTPPFALVAGTIAAPDLERVRAGLTAAITEVDPVLPPGTSAGLHGSGSSNDFHVLLRLVDDDGRVVERQFTGYAGNLHQQDYLGVQAALPALDAITALAPAAGAPTAETRELFADRFAAAATHFDDKFYWWVKERFVELARHVGSPPAIPALVSRLRVTKPGDRSQVDTRAHALAALAAITGWNARAETGSDEAAAARYTAECRAR